ncbi:MAG: hypothetical protein K2K72_06775 [Duncaniella sp.]|nr:hypothetical protein [Duncaniella sp.]
MKTTLSTLLITLLGALPCLALTPELSPTRLLPTEDTEAAAASPYAFSNPAKAFEAVNTAATTSTTVTLYIAPGVYWLDDPDDPQVRVNPRGQSLPPYAVELSCDTLSIIGLADNPEDVVLAVNRGQTQGALGNFTMLHFKGWSLTTENITWGNYCNVDLIYPRDPSRNRPKRRDAIVQAQIGICHGTDRVFARNCRFISRLNLCPLVGGRQSLYKDCYFECTDDALSGSAVYLDCKFTFHSGKPFYSTAATGAVFLNCDVNVLTSGTQYFTKMPGAVTVIDTRFTSATPVNICWTRDASPVRCYQSNVTLNGRPFTIDASRPELSVMLDGTQLLEAYKVTMPDGEVIYNTPNLLGGSDGWDPLGMRPAIEKAQTLTGQKLLGLPVALLFPQVKEPLAPQGQSVTLTPAPRLWGDFDASIPAPCTFSWLSPTYLTLKPQAQSAVVTTAYTMPVATTATVSVTTSYGLAGAVNLPLEPYLKDAPTFVTAPSVELKKSVVNLHYNLSGDADRDVSYIVWYRSTRPDLSDSVAVRHGHGPSACQYPLSAPDKGSYISAVVYPRLNDSRTGSPSASARLDKPVSALAVSLNPLAREKELTTSFAEIPLRSPGAGRAGFWHFDTYKPADTAPHQWKADSTVGWYYGKGVDAITGQGLIQSSRGARLFYTPMRTSCKSMEVSLIAEPAKGPGQGFGSATGQYMDICIAFDPATLTGYGVRIERTPDYDKAVTFTLVSYRDGNVTPLTEPVATSCFRNPCSITVSLDKRILSAKASTTAPSDGPRADQRIRPSVSLTAQAGALAGTSLMIQHTGSTGASATLLRDLHITWN